MILWLIIGLLLLMYLAYRGIPIMVATLVASMFILLTSGMPLIEGLTGPYMQGMAGYFQRFFLIFLLGAIFGKITEVTGSAESIARSVTKTFGPKYVVVSVIIATAILCYGGVNLFVALFAIYPLAMSLFKQAGIPRRMFPAAYVAGCGTFAMTGPFTPAIQNLIPTQYLGTDATAAALPGTIVSIFMFVAVVAYMQYQTKKAKENGEIFEERDTDTEVKDLALPNPWLSIAPMIVLLFILNVLKKDVIIALGVGIVVGCLLLYKYLPSIKEMWDHIQKASGNATFSIANTCAAVGFGTVVAATPAFKVAIDTVTQIGGHPLIAAGIATSILTGISGSASGGLGIAIPIIADYFLPLGVNPEALHRIAVIACGGLDSLPHNGFVITLLVYSGLTHKQAYKDIFITTVAIPLIALILLVALFFILPGWV